MGSQHLAIFFYLSKIIIFMSAVFKKLIQYSCLENPMNRGAWRATVHGDAKSQTQLSD